MSLSFESPWFLGALAGPMLLLLLYGAMARPAKQRTGTLAILREAAGDARPRAAMRRQLPAWLLLVVAALFSLSLALARPWVSSGGSAPIRHVAIELSPALGLDVDGRESPPVLDARRTRLGVALKTAEPLFERWRAAGARVQWHTAERAAFETGAESAAVLPELLAAAAAATSRALPSGQFDLVILASPAAVPAAGNYIVAGGETAAGFIAAGPEQWFHSDGTLRDAGRAPGALRLESSAPEPFASFARLYASERGLELVDSRATPARLVLETFSCEAQRAPTQTSGREGFEIDLTARPTADSEGAVSSAPAGEVWLAGAEAEAWVVASPGRIAVADGEWSAARGAEAAFPVALAELFDRMLLPPAEVVPAALRGAVPLLGELGRPERDVDRASRFSLAAPLALAAAALFSFAQLLLWMRRPPPIRGRPNP